jgi:hypothetical protein
MQVFERRGPQRKTAGIAERIRIMVSLATEKREGHEVYSCRQADENDSRFSA